MAKQNSDNSFKLNIGGPSIILLVTVLGLSVFAILSVRAAYSGLKLARTSENAISTYYVAESKAAQAEFEIRECVEVFSEANFSSGLTEADLTKALEERLLGIEYVTGAAGGMVSCDIPVSEVSAIHMELSGAENYSGLEVTVHRYEITNTDDYDGSAFEVNIIEIN